MHHRSSVPPTRAGATTVRTATGSAAVSEACDLAAAQARTRRVPPEPVRQSKSSPDTAPTDQVRARKPSTRLGRTDGAPSDASCPAGAATTTGPVVVLLRVFFPIPVRHECAGALQPVDQPLHASPPLLPSSCLQQSCGPRLTLHGDPWWNGPKGRPRLPLPRLSDRGSSLAPLSPNLSLIDSPSPRLASAPCTLLFSGLWPFLRRRPLYVGSLHRCLDQAASITPTR